MAESTIKSRIYNAIWNDIIDGVYHPDAVHVEPLAETVGAMSEKELSAQIKKLEKQMLEFAKNLDFEKAAAVRDKLAELKSRVLGAGVPTET